MENNTVASTCCLLQSFLRPTRAQPKGILCWWLQRVTKSCPSGLLPGIFHFSPILPPECVCGNSYSLIKTQLNYLLSQKNLPCPTLERANHTLHSITSEASISSGTKYTVVDHLLTAEHCSKGATDIAMNKVDKELTVYKYINR